MTFWKYTVKYLVEILWGVQINSFLKTAKKLFFKKPTAEQEKQRLCRGKNRLITFSTLGST